MSTSQPKKLSLDEWLSLAQKPNLSEAEHQQLLVSLPNDPAERQNWLNELSVAMALNESAKNNPEWLKNVLGQLQQKSPAGVARKSSRLWPKAIAATIVGGLIFTLVERPKFEKTMVPVSERESSADKLQVENKVNRMQEENIDITRKASNDQDAKKTIDTAPAM